MRSNGLKRVWPERVGQHTTRQTNRYEPTLGGIFTRALRDVEVLIEYLDPGVRYLVPRRVLTDLTVFSIRLRGN